MPGDIYFAVPPLLEGGLLPKAAVSRALEGHEISETIWLNQPC